MNLVCCDIWTDISHKIAICHPTRSKLQDEEGMLPLWAASHPTPSLLWVSPIALPPFIYLYSSYGLFLKTFLSD